MLPPKEEKKTNPSTCETLLELLKTFATKLKSGETKVAQKGEIKNFGGIKGAKVSYCVSLRTLVDEPSKPKEHEENANTSRQERC
jgi:hypothetical protein